MKRPIGATANNIFHTFKNQTIKSINIIWSSCDVHEGDEIAGRCVKDFTSIFITQEKCTRKQVIESHHS